MYTINQAKRDSEIKFIVPHLVLFYLYTNQILFCDLSRSPDCSNVKWGAMEPFG